MVFLIVEVLYTGKGGRENEGLDTSTCTTMMLCYILYRKCLAFVSVPLLTNELAEFVNQWNTHTIRHNHLADCPAGVPVDLYEMPVEFGKLYNDAVSVFPQKITLGR